MLFIINVNINNNIRSTDKNAQSRQRFLREDIQNMKNICLCMVSQFLRCWSSSVLMLGLGVQSVDLVTVMTIGSQQ